MKFSTYEVKKTTVQAVQITSGNMQEICDLVGYRLETGLDSSERTVTFIQLNKKRARSGKTTRGHIGGWLVKDMDVADKWHFYTDKEFRNKHIVPEEDI